jgi:hypothetical protein
VLTDGDDKANLRFDDSVNDKKRDDGLWHFEAGDRAAVREGAPQPLGRTELRAAQPPATQK